ncbi:hypothetical protein B5X24_HaOG208927 [Helicoverpa armigera]|uniref:Uncharacterized protein n=1 Tax=Helicoverpa armigera TaxID=29058 RepID=A0A2W1BPX8_HELAM|nr:hypothetical protein B5X24_HaOG208927 [Helicoverpa armigera]
MGCDLAPKKKREIKTLLQHTKFSQRQIADIAGVPKFLSSQQNKNFFGPGSANSTSKKRRLEKIPTSSWRKNQIMEWLQEKDIVINEQDTKTHLMQKVNSMKNVYKKYAVDEMAKDKGVTILRLAPIITSSTPLNS